MAQNCVVCGKKVVYPDAVEYNEQTYCKGCLDEIKGKTKINESPKDENVSFKNKDDEVKKIDDLSLIEGEEVLLNVNSKQLILTTHRIRQENYRGTGGLTSMTSIMLEEICSCTLISKRYLILLILAIVLGGSLIVAGSEERDAEGAIILGVIIFIVFLLLFIFVRPKKLALKSAGDAIEVSLSGISVEETKKIIDKVEVAKNNRYLLINK